MSVGDLAADPILTAVERVGLMVEELREEIKHLAAEIRRQNDIAADRLQSMRSIGIWLGTVLSSRPMKALWFLFSAGVLTRLFGFSVAEAGAFLASFVQIGALP